MAHQKAHIYIYSPPSPSNRNPHQCFCPPAAATLFFSPSATTQLASTFLPMQLASCKHLPATRDEPPPRPPRRRPRPPGSHLHRLPPPSAPPPRPPRRHLRLRGPKFGDVPRPAASLHFVVRACFLLPAPISFTTPPSDGLGSARTRQVARADEPIRHG